MAATLEDIKSWLVGAEKGGATHLIVVCDTFDHDDYPVFVSKEEDVFKKIAEFDEKDMQEIMEVYNMSQDIETQLQEKRAGGSTIIEARRRAEKEA